MDEDVAGTVTLTVTNAEGCKSVKQSSLVIHPAPGFDALAATYPNGSVCSPLKVDLSTANITHATRYDWRVKDNPADPGIPYGEGGALAPGVNTLSATMEFDNTTTAPIQKIVQLQLTSAAGCKQVKEFTVDVPGKLVPKISHPAPKGCPLRSGKRAVTIKDDSEAPAGATYTWTIDGNPIYPVVSGTDYTVELENLDLVNDAVQTVRLEINAAGCVRSSDLVFTTFPRVDPQFTATVDVGGTPVAWDPADPPRCAPVKATFNGTGAQVLVWSVANGISELNGDGATFTTDLQNSTTGVLTYTVRLTGSNEKLCSDYIEKQYKVYPSVEAKFTVETLDACTPYKIRLQDVTEAPAGYTPTWGLDGGVETPPGSKIYVYDTPGTKTITLKSKSGNCETEAAPYQFEVLQPIQAALAGVLPSDKVCAPATLEFQNNTTGAKKITWYFEGTSGAGEEHQATVTTVRHLYQNRTGAPITYNVTIVAENERGCGHLPNSTATTSVTIYPEPLPANVMLVTKKCNPVEVEFESKSLGLTDYEWTFTPVGMLAAYGAQVVKTGQQAGGPVTVQLTNTHENTTIEYEVSYSGSNQWAGGPLCSAGPLQLEKVSVPPALKVDITPDKSEICSGAEVTFADKSLGGALEHQWVFGDGGQATSDRGQPVRHTFHNTSSLDLTYDVSVKTTQIEFGCSEEKHFPVIVHPHVEAGFSFVKTDECAYPLPVTFTNLSKGNTASAGFTSTYEWDYGYTVGGNPQQETLPHRNPHEHKFQNALPNSNSTYLVKLVAKQQYPSGLVCEGNFSAPIEVPPALIPQFTVDKYEGCIPHKVLLSSTGTGGAALEYTWDFGDGGQSATTVGNAQDVEHEYNNLSNTTPKNYTITLTARNALGCVRSVSQTVVTYPKVTAGFTLSGEEFCSPGTLKVENISQNGLEYIWTLVGSGAPVLPPTTTLDPLIIPLSNATASPQNYTLKLLARAVYGTVTCQDNMQKTYRVLPDVQANFSVSPANEGCNPLTVSFTNNSTGTNHYEWYLVGEPSAFSNDVEPAPREFSNSDREHDKVYEVKLLARNSLGCSSEATQRITVYPLLESRFMLSKRAGCTPLSVEAFVDPSKLSSLYSYQWDVQGGTPVTVNAPSTGPVVFTNGTKLPPSVVKGKIKLVTSLTTHPECKLASEEEVEVYPAVYPAFDVLPESCTPFAASFRNTTDVFDEPEAKYFWSFSNGVTVEGQREPLVVFSNPSHTSDAVIQAKLHVTSSHGCEAEVSKSITVHPKPKAEFSIEGASESCPPFDVVFRNTSVGTNLTYLFDFGDGSTQTMVTQESVGHRFDNLSGSELSYTISLTATSAFGCTDMMSQSVRVFPGVTAGFSFLPGDAGCSPFLVELKNNGSSELQYTWDFGDGKGSDMFEPVHTFENSTVTDVVYNVSLTAESANKCTATANKQVTVYATPKAKFLASPPLQVFPNSKVTIENQSDPADPSWVYSWDFGDGHTSSLRDPLEHVYARWAPKEWDFSFPIKFSIKSPHCEDAVHHNVLVYAPLPTTTFDTEYFEACAPMTVYFRNNTLYANEYLWDFGDSVTSTDREPIHTYTKPGVYNVKLIATGDGGPSYFQAIYTVHPNPIAKFSMHPDTVLLPNALVKAQDESVDAHEYYWDFGDGSVSTERSPVHQYESPGEFAVKLKVKSSAGCEDEVSQSPSVIVFPPAKVRFPNVFRPSESGSNGGRYDIHDVQNVVFHPVAEAVVDYTLLIFNRWGELIFESNDVNVGWDGYRNGKLCDVGVYTWRAMGHFFNGEIFDLRGNVTLLR